MSYWTETATESNQFERIGHPGKFYKVINVTSTTDFTGSNFGYGAIVVSGSSTGTISLSGGGTLNINTFTPGVVYEFSVSKVEVSAGLVYVLKKQGI